MKESHLRAKNQTASGQAWWDFLGQAFGGGVNMKKLFFVIASIFASGCGGEQATGRSGEEQYLYGRFVDASPTFTDMGDGMIRDNRTGLVWAWGKIAKDVPWSTAKNLCQEWERQGVLPGKGWRLPDTFELLSILQYCRTDRFAGYLYPFWVSCKVDRDEARSWRFSTYSPAWNPMCIDVLWLISVGDVLGGRCLSQSGGPVAVLCVRSAPPVPPKENRFVDRGETVFDTLTGLEWEKEPSFQKKACPHPDECYAYGCEPCDDTEAWLEAIEACIKLTKAGGGWRLPDLKELYSLVVYQDGKIQPLDSAFQGPDGYDFHYLSSTALGARVIFYPTNPYDTSQGGAALIGGLYSFPGGIWVGRCVRGPI